MKVEILDLAEVDLQAGFDFYESQELGVGNYFSVQYFQTSIRWSCMQESIR